MQLSNKQLVQLGEGQEWLGNGFLEELAFEDEKSGDVHSRAWNHL